MSQFEMFTSMLYFSLALLLSINCITGRGKNTLFFILVTVVGLVCEVGGCAYF